MPGLVKKLLKYPVVFLDNSIYSKEIFDYYKINPIEMDQLILDKARDNKHYGIETHKVIAETCYRRLINS